MKSLLMLLWLASSSTNWATIGEYKFTYWLWDVYEAKLEAQSAQFDRSSSYKLTLTYLRDIKSEDLVEETYAQWEHLGYDSKQDTQWLEQLHRAFPDVRKGDSISIVTQGDGSGKLFHNEKLRYQFAPSPQFGKLMDIWLSEKSKYPKLARQLTAGGSK